MSPESGSVNWAAVAIGVSVLSGCLTLLVGVLGLLWRSTVERLETRVTVLEQKNDERSRDLAVLQERSVRTQETLSRIESILVPRVEWEQRHNSTDRVLSNILDLLRARRSESAHDLPPNIRG
jgi:hypothetical protein